MTEQSYTICLTEAVARNPEVRLAASVSLELKPGEHVAIVGPNGAGKSLLVDLLTGKYPLLSGSVAYDFRPSVRPAVYENVKYMAFRDTYGSADANYYYQQRWNAHDQDEVPLVRELLGAYEDSEEVRRLFELFRLDVLMDKPVILLSSGELRKFQLAKALLGAPRILIMDNPFIGLDAGARALLGEVLARLSGLGTLQIVLVLSVERDIPSFITHVVPVAERRVGVKVSREAWLDEGAGVMEEAADGLSERILGLPYAHEAYDSDEVVRLNRVSIRYGDRTILQDLDWTVRRGERWALSGENGAGKSTIWDIKRHIGYVSPEMHRAYQKNLPAQDIVASGLHDSIGLYRRPAPGEVETCAWWMEVFGVGGLAARSFLHLSSGEQRLCLLARAFVKDPELLILDEPLHGLDTRNRRRVRAVIEAFCHRRGKTLVMVTHYEDELPPCIDHRLHLLRRR